MFSDLEVISLLWLMDGLPAQMTLCQPSSYYKMPGQLWTKAEPKKQAVRVGGMFIFLNLLLQLDNRVSPTIGRSPGIWSGSGIWGCSARTTSVDVPFLHFRVRLHVNGPLDKVDI